MHVRLFLAAWLVTSATAAPFLAAGCWYDDVDIGSDCAPGTPPKCCPCPWPEDCPDGAPPPLPECVDGGTEAGDGSQSSCTDGTCVVPAPDWAPVLLATGAEIDVPVCPENAPEIAFEGRPAPGAWGLVCPTCTCDSPVGGGCHVPTTWTVTSDACAGGGVNTSFDPPTAWEGKCSATNSIPAGLQCGGVPCVGGIDISAPTIEEPPCTPHGDDPPPGPAHLVTGGFGAPFARACARAPWPACEGEEVCLPLSGAPFATCLMHAGDESCPEGWPVKRLLYGQVDDQRQCEACSCGPPMGAMCSVKVHVYSDAACTVQRLEVDISPEMGGGCFPLMSGVALAGIAAEVLDYQAGTCEPHGSEPVGDVFLADATTFCCREPMI
ncbi:hypothetical protein [Polyangium sp. 6x1]|uniref:hypothetical protein n=1 Tax=Polyangium sp. 6x1 TaxID=3042689 RepID=UPI0024822A0A|nr:hypothetical protein [Polyangium sp. 6x1]MDI1445950.1 hypothetical protein [Polyangium sp. 6x1]